MGAEEMHTGTDTPNPIGISVEVVTNPSSVPPDSKVLKGMSLTPKIQISIYRLWFCMQWNQLLHRGKEPHINGSSMWVSQIRKTVCMLLEDHWSLRKGETFQHQRTNWSVLVLYHRILRIFSKRLSWKQRKCRDNNTRHSDKSHVCWQAEKFIRKSSYKKNERQKPKFRSKKRPLENKCQRVASKKEHNSRETKKEDKDLEGKGKGGE